MALDRRIRDRRILAALLVLVMALAVGGGLLSRVRGESMDRFWAVAKLDSFGHAEIDETVDWDFGTELHHGIYRDVPGLRPTSPVTVESAAPHQMTLSDLGSQTRIRIGDPSTEVTGHQSYRIAYPLDVLFDGPRFAWNGFGSEWPVGAGRVELHVVAPFTFGEPRCVHGARGSDETCVVTQPEPGHLVAVVEDLDANEGVTLYADRGTRLDAAPPLPTPGPAPVPTDGPDGSLLAIALVAAASALIGMIGATRLVRRAGREHVAVGDAVDAAWAGDVDGPTRRVDQGQLAEYATTEFSPPSGITPAQGGVMMLERVVGSHQAAWLLQAAVDGYIDIDESGEHPVIIRRERADGRTQLALDEAFAGRDRITLGAYDKDFARGWKAIREELKGWQRSAGLWEPDSHRRVVSLRLLVGIPTALAAAPGLLWAGWMAGRSGGAVLSAVVFAALLIGAGTAAVVTAWELRVRTVRGSGIWLRLESFRRFLAQSEARHVDQAAGLGLLREYTAWAVALGEVDRWTRAMKSSSITTEDRSSAHVGLAPSIAALAATTSTAPSSSSGGGGSSGGVGGGGGGGGGGSW